MDTPLTPVTGKFCFVATMENDTQISGQIKPTVEVLPTGKSLTMTLSFTAPLMPNSTCIGFAVFQDGSSPLVECGVAK